MAQNIVGPNGSLVGSGGSDINSFDSYLESLMQQQYAWGQQQFQQNSQLTDKVVGDLLNNYSQLSGIGNQLMQQYQNIFEPEYQKLAQDANNYASQARIQQAMGAAESGVSQAFDSQRQAATADLQSFGIDPSSGRYAQLDTAERTQQAAAQAGAGFQAEQATEATGRGLRSEALQLGSVMPGQATTAYNAAGQSATAAENAKLANSQEGVNMMGSPQQYAGAYKPPPTYPASNTSGGGGGNKQSGSNGPQPNLDGTPSTGPGDQQDLGAYNYGGSGGGGNGPSFPGGAGNAQIISVDDSGGSPVDTTTTDGGNGPTTSDGGYNYGEDDQPSYDDSGYAEGGAIPMHASPSHGRVTDDIPAKVNQTGEGIRVNAGEFIIPKHTVAWKGEKYFQDLIARSRKERGGAQAKPEVRPALQTSRG